MLFTGLLNISCRTQVHQPWNIDTHKGLGPPPSITHQENVLQPDLMEAVSQLSSLFSDNFCLCQVDIKLVSTISNT